MASSCYLSLPAVELGAPRRVADLAEVAGDPRLAERLAQNGLSTYTVLETPIGEVVRRVAAGILERGGIGPASVDLVVLTSGAAAASLPDAPAVLGALQDLGLGQVACIGVSLGECANFAAALAVAEAMVGAGRSALALVMVCDQAPAGGRLYGGDTTVLSDGVAGCLVSRWPLGEPGFEICSVVTRSRLSVQDGDPQGRSFSQLLRLHLDSFSAVCRAALQAAEVAPATLAAFLPPNLNLYMADFLAAAAGASKKSVLRSNITAWGHVQACDPLLNLATAAASPDLAEGAPLLAVALGPVSWGAIVLKRAHP